VFADRMYDPTAQADRAIIDAVGAIAKDRGVPRAQVAMAWLLQKPGITSPIVGAGKPHHLNDAVAALAVRLTEAEVRRLEEPYRPHPVAGTVVR
jgi:aryl-alcohol dehydrogenase-like predicted oxidoreductase